MMKTIALLMRGAVADNEQAIRDANAVAILRQQIRDAAGALAGARRELAVATAYRAAEDRALGAIAGRIVDLSAGARAALAAGREDLGREAAALIAALEDERADRLTALARFAVDVVRLKDLVATGQAQLRDLDRGLQTARATEAARRAGLDGRRTLALSTSALGDARQTLARLRERQQRDDDIGDALAILHGEANRGVEDRLDAAGYGRTRADPDAILERLRASA